MENILLSCAMILVAITLVLQWMAFQRLVASQNHLTKLVKMMIDAFDAAAERAADIKKERKKGDRVPPPEPSQPFKRG